MTAIPILQNGPWPGRLSPRTQWAMAKKSDQSEAASAIREGQKRRLNLLREALNPVQADAARVAGVSVWSWNRMEKPGGTGIDPVAVARFCAFHQIPGEYILSGDLSGLPPKLQRDLAKAEGQTEAPAKAHTEAL